MILDEIYEEIRGIADGTIGCNDAELEYLAHLINTYLNSDEIEDDVY